jgi:hypothetical protein
VNHFIDSLRDEVRIVKRVPKKFSSKYGYCTLEIPPSKYGKHGFEIYPFHNDVHKIIYFYMKLKTSSAYIFCRRTGFNKSCHLNLLCALEMYKYVSDQGILRPVSKVFFVGVADI